MTWPEGEYEALCNRCGYRWYLRLRFTGFIPDEEWVVCPRCKAEARALRLPPVKT